MRRLVRFKFNKFEIGISSRGLYRDLISFDIGRLQRCWMKIVYEYQCKVYWMKRIVRRCYDVWRSFTEGTGVAQRYQRTKYFRHFLNRNPIGVSDERTNQIGILFELVGVIDIFDCNSSSWIFEQCAIFEDFEVSSQNIKNLFIPHFFFFSICSKNPLKIQKSPKFNWKRPELLMSNLLKSWL